jgi:hypothetical protein
MQMAEKLGKTIIEADPNMKQMMSTMQDPSYRAKVEDAMKGMKDDPELKPMLEELEKSGPMVSSDLEASLPVLLTFCLISQLFAGHDEVLERPGDAQ